MSDKLKPAYLTGRGRGRGTVNGGVSLPDASVTVDRRVNSHTATSTGIYAFRTNNLQTLSKLITTSINCVKCSECFSSIFIQI